MIFFLYSFPCILSEIIQALNGENYLYFIYLTTSSSVAVPQFLFTPFNNYWVFTICQGVLAAGYATVISIDKDPALMELHSNRENNEYDAI